MADHVKIKYCDSEAVIVLVEDSFEFIIQEDSALVKAKAAGGVKRAALYAY